MNTIKLNQEDNSKNGIVSVKNTYSASFLSFKKALLANTELRRQIRDIVDLGLMEYAYSRNTSFIDAVRKKAEAETMDLMMQFVKGADNYQALRKIIQRNRIIKTLANKDMSDHKELLTRVTRLTS
jgi:hypothetical protein